MAVVYYQGERIYFRPLELADEPLIRQFINDPQVWYTLSHRLPANEQREREWLERQGTSDKDIIFGIVVREGDRLIGSCGLHAIDQISRSAVFGIMVGDLEMQNQGYGTEAVRLTLKLGFEEYNLNRIELQVYEFNGRAMRCYEKAGYVLEGRRRQAMYRHGRYHDVLVYSVLRQEYFAGGNGQVAEARAEAGVA